jgi:hypothetical protein
VVPIAGRGHLPADSHGCLEQISGRLDTVARIALVQTPRGTLPEAPERVSDEWEVHFDASLIGFCVLAN